MTTIGTLFSGGEGVGVGARAAGLDHLWGVEYDDAIAQVARMNGFNTITGNVMDKALMISLPRPDVIHASPVCKNASNAKANGEESPLDIATADATCMYIDRFLPDIFTLENVYGYRTFTAFAHIIECLNRNGYSVNYWHLNAADYGVPQTRKRLILVAKSHGKPRKPQATHAEPSKLTPMFDDRLPWVGWYAAIEDLIDTLPPSQFAPWQFERLPDELRQSVIVHPTEMRTTPIVDGSSPYFTQTVGMASTAPRAFILNGTPNDYGASGTACAECEPVYTMTGSMDKRPARAFIMAGGDLWTPETYADQPAFALTDSRNNHPMRAYIVPGGNATSFDIRNDDEPARTVGDVDRVGNLPRAMLIGDQKGQSNTDQEPSDTIRAFSGGGATPRAWIQHGRVVQMTPRALARFQSFPDWYQLPDKKSLARTVIGNAVPPLLYQRVIEAQL